MTLGPGGAADGHHHELEVSILLGQDEDGRDELWVSTTCKVCRASLTTRRLATPAEVQAELARRRLRRAREWRLP